MLPPSDSDEEEDKAPAPKAKGGQVLSHDANGHCLHYASAMPPTFALDMAVTVSMFQGATMMPSALLTALAHDMAADRHACGSNPRFKKTWIRFNHEGSVGTVQCTYCVQDSAGQKTSCTEQAGFLHSSEEPGSQ
jgi:hypothetical protein